MHNINDLGSLDTFNLNHNGNILLLHKSVQDLFSLAVDRRMLAQNIHGIREQSQKYSFAENTRKFSENILWLSLF